MKTNPEIKKAADFEPFQLSAESIEQPIIIESAELQAGQVVERFENGAPASVVLAEDTIAKGFLFKKGTVLSFYPDNKIRYGTLAREETKSIDGRASSVMVTFKAGSLLNFHRSGAISQGTNTMKATLMHPYNFKLDEGLVAFSETGQLIFCKCADALPIKNSNGNSARTQPGTYIYLSDDPERPSLTEIYLEKEVRWNDFILKAEERTNFYDGVALDKPGPLMAFYSPYNLFYKGFFMSKNEQVLLHPNGELRRFFLAYETVINDIELKPNRTIIELSPEKKLERIYSTHEVIIKGVTYPAFRNILFDEDGEVVQA